MRHAVVLAGGSGTRFWPESRAARSKQFLDLTGRGPMIVETLRRIAPLFPERNRWVVAGEKDAPHLPYRSLGIPRGNLLLEPRGRNTAPAMALAAERILRRDPDAVIAAMPADHAVADRKTFRAVFRKALRVAGTTGKIVTLGIAPKHPATGYGYIERGEPLPGAAGVHRVRRFTEKPDLPTARRFLRSGRFYWNSGVFFCRAGVYLDRMRRFLPDLWMELERAISAGRGPAFRKRLRSAYARIPAVSVDYGILEKEEGILVIPSDFGWNDLGTWRSLHEFLGGGDANVTFGDVLLSGCRGSLVRTDRGLVAAVGLEDIVVVRSGEAVLVCRRDRSEEVKEIVEQVRKRYPGLA
ncbi:MAG: mannose-1-phosphate guanylyltransferase [Deltaproteobacteria bacterium]